MPEPTRIDPKSPTSRRQLETELGKEGTGAFLKDVQAGVKPAVKLKERWKLPVEVDPYEKPAGREYGPDELKLPENIRKQIEEAHARHKAARKGKETLLAEDPWAALSQAVVTEREAKAKEREEKSALTRARTHKIALDMDIKQKEYNRSLLKQNLNFAQIESKSKLAVLRAIAPYIPERDERGKIKKISLLRPKPEKEYLGKFDGKDYYIWTVGFGKWTEKDLKEFESLKKGKATAKPGPTGPTGEEGDYGSIWSVTAKGATSAKPVSVPATRENILKYKSKVIPALGGDRQANIRLRDLANEVIRRMDEGSDAESIARAVETLAAEHEKVSIKFAKKGVRMAAEASGSLETRRQAWSEKEKTRVAGIAKGLTGNRLKAKGWAKKAKKAARLAVTKKLKSAGGSTFEVVSVDGKSQWVEVTPTQINSYINMSRDKKLVGDEFRKKAAIQIRDRYSEALRDENERVSTLKADMLNTWVDAGLKKGAFERWYKGTKRVPTIKPREFVPTRPGAGSFMGLPQPKNAAEAFEVAAKGISKPPVKEWPEPLRVWWEINRMDWPASKKRRVFSSQAKAQGWA